MSSILPLNVCPLDVGSVLQFEPHLWTVFDINSKTVRTQDRVPDQASVNFFVKAVLLAKTSAQGYGTLACGDMRDVNLDANTNTN